MRGSQTPRILSHPPYTITSGGEAVEYLEAAGLSLDPWQHLLLDVGLAERPDGGWANFEVAMVVARQNGKGEVLMAREVVGLFLLGERLQIHSAHQFKTCREAFLRIKTLIVNSPGLERRVARIHEASGAEGVELRKEYGGGRLQFVARSSNSGRGFTGDLIIFDEAQILGNEPIDAMMPTLSAVPNPQIWYAGTAGTQQSIHLGRVRRRALAGESPSLAYLEWSVDESAYDPAEVADWARANPALGIRISTEYVEREREAMSADGFASERLGVGTWPDDDTHAVIGAEQWDAGADPRGGRPTGPIVFALDANPERSAAAIAVAGRRADGWLTVELVDYRIGLDWVPERMVDLVRDHDPAAVVIDRAGPAGTFVAALEAEGAPLVIPTSQDFAQAAEGFADAVAERTLRHRGEHPLDAAVAGAAKREFPSGVWAWGRRSSATDISPLVAASLAVWGFLTQVDGAGQPAAYVL